MAAPRIRAIDDWSLLACIAGVETTVVLACLPTQDLSSALGVSEMIQLSVRLSVPFLYLAFAASSINVLAPSAFSRWLLRNRRSLGLGFAAGMASQAQGCSCFGSRPGPGACDTLGYYIASDHQG